MSYWEMALPTYIENWPPALCALSIPQVDIPLTLDEAHRLGTNMMDWGEAFIVPGEGMCDITDIRGRVAVAVEQMPAGAFVRLGSRSPKDSWEWYRTGAKISVGEDPLRLLLGASERIYEDIALAIRQNYPPHIFVRQWVNMPEC